MSATRHWVMGAGLFLLLSALAHETAAQDRLPIIDMHQHTIWGSDHTVQSTLAVMDELNIVTAFLSGPLEEVYDWAKVAPDRFIPSPMIPSQKYHVDGGDDFHDIEKLRAEYLSGKLHGMGEIWTQYFGVPPNAPGLEPYFALAEELDLPVLIHIEGIGAPEPNFRLSAGHPLLLEEVLVRHPKLRIYLENAGYPFLHEMIALMYQYPQVHADLSTITRVIPREAFHDYLRALVRAGYGKRLMFGTDSPSWKITQTVEAIESATFLTDEQKRDIFYNNAAEFLRLSDEVIATHHNRK